jgi:hypothetical protein
MPLRWWKAVPYPHLGYGYKIVVFGYSVMVTGKLHQQQNKRDQLKMAYERPHPNQAAIDRARYEVAFQLGNKVVIWRGRWIWESRLVIVVGVSKLHVQTIAGGVVAVWKNVCCLIIHGLETDLEYATDDSNNGGDIGAVSDGSEDKV